MSMVTDEERALYEILTEDFEEEGGYQQDRRGGVDLTYITGEQCITRLNKAFGPLGWTFEIRERCWRRPSTRTAR
jgi:recombination DNA repair RAD52 pathway protein